MIDHASIAVSDLEAAGRFYDAVLGSIVSDVLTSSCGARRSREDASPVDEMGSHTWSTI
jgi:catechol 2,3-dioxygenase-like lactoylglutathione lyase family enzyme